MATGCAFDNFDVNVETLDGSGSIHITLGIMFQNSEHNIISDNVSSIEDPKPIPASSIRKQKFEYEEEELPPYRKNTTLQRLL